MSDLYAGVVGQESALGALRAAAARPVHAYLLVGPPGTGKSAAAISFAAALVCPAGGCGACSACRRAREGTHPDVVVVERHGPAISLETALGIAGLAVRSPLEGERMVLVLVDFHLVKEAGPALLKTVEEPPPSTIFVITAEFVPPELVTIASRCVRVDFSPLTSAAVVAALVTDGVSSERAAELAGAAGGRLDRARLLAADADFDARLRAWHAVPETLDGTGATVARLADELVDLLDRSVAPLRARQESEVAALEVRNARALEVNGKLGRHRAGTKAGVKELEEVHRRQVRRQRTDELKVGLAVLARAFQDRYRPGPPGASAGLTPTAARRAVAAGALVQRLAADLAHNPGETLALQALLLRLGHLADQT
ncbi:MAG: ATP-binding protein [Acidimicrobiales bacterium]